MGVRVPEATGHPPLPSVLRLPTHRERTDRSNGVALDAHDVAPAGEGRGVHDEGHRPCAGFGPNGASENAASPVSPASVAAPGLTVSANRSTASPAPPANERLGWLRTSARVRLRPSRARPRPARAIRGPVDRGRGGLRAVGQRGCVGGDRGRRRRLGLSPGRQADIGGRGGEKGQHGREDPHRQSGEGDTQAPWASGTAAGGRDGSDRSDLSKPAPDSGRPLQGIHHRGPHSSVRPPTPIRPLSHRTRRFPFDRLIRPSMPEHARPRLGSPLGLSERLSVRLARTSGPRSPASGG